MPSNESLLTQKEDHDTLIRVETKLEALTDEIRNSHSTNSKIVSDHEARIRTLENIIEIGKGAQRGINNNKRTIYEIVGLIAAVLTAIATYMLARGH